MPTGERHLRLLSFLAGVACACASVAVLRALRAPRRRVRPAEKAEGGEELTSSSRSGTRETASRPEATLLLRHIAKQRSVGTLVRTAGAFGCEEVVLVGSRKQVLFGSQGSDRRVGIRNFYGARQALEYLRRDAPRPGDVIIVGIEIDPHAVSVTSDEFRRRCRAAKRVCFVPGNEGIGMTEGDKALCDWLCYIPQRGQATASLNVSTATAIILHEFACAVGVPEAARVGDKYVVAEPLGVESLADDAYAGAIRSERASRRTAREDDSDDGCDFDGSPFEHD
jgi:tRNA G18 (ribose-2'-O)-methylase SpoU